MCHHCAYADVRDSDDSLHIRQATEVDASNVVLLSRLYYNIALCLSQLGKPSDAVTACTTATRLDEEYIKPLIKRAKLYLQLGNRMGAYV